VIPPSTITLQGTAGRFERLGGGRAAGEEDASSFPREGQPGNWRAHLDRDDAEAYWAVAGDQLQYLGYMR